MSAGRATAGALLAAVALCGCATPRPVRDLASTTAANVSVVNSGLRKFARDGELVAEERVRLLRQQEERLSATRKELRLKEEALEFAGEREKLDALRKLDALLQTLAELEKEVTARAAEVERTLAGQRSPLTPPVNPLTDSASRLADLAEQDDTGDQVSFLGRFIREVVKDVREAERVNAAARADTRKGLRAGESERAKALTPGREDLADR